MAESSTLKLAGYTLCLCMPLLAPLGLWLHTPWLSPILVFGLFPVLGALIGEDRSLPVVGLHRSPMLVAYLDFLPRMYALAWMATLTWAAGYASRMNLSGTGLTALIVGVGFGSAVAICTAHELMHHRSQFDVLLARLMTALCLYGHMVVEHFHHHATVGDVAAGQLHRAECRSITLRLLTSCRACGTPGPLKGRASGDAGYRGGTTACSKTTPWRSDWPSCSSPAAEAQGSFSSLARRCSRSFASRSSPMFTTTAWY